MSNFYSIDSVFRCSTFWLFAPSDSKIAICYFSFVIAWKDIPIIVKYDKVGNFLWRKDYKDPIYAEGIFDGKLLKNGNLMFVGGNYIDFF